MNTLDPEISRTQTPLILPVTGVAPVNSDFQRLVDRSLQQIGESQTTEQLPEIEGLTEFELPIEFFDEAMLNVDSGKGLPFSGNGLPDPMTLLEDPAEQVTDPVQHVILLSESGVTDTNSETVIPADTEQLQLPVPESDLLIQETGSGEHLGTVSEQASRVAHNPADDKAHQIADDLMPDTTVQTSVRVADDPGLIAQRPMAPGPEATAARDYQDQRIESRPVRATSLTAMPGSEGDAESAAVLQHNQAPARAVNEPGRQQTAAGFNSQTGHGEIHVDLDMTGAKFSQLLPQDRDPAHKGPIPDSAATAISTSAAPAAKPPASGQVGTGGLDATRAGMAQELSVTEPGWEKELGTRISYMIRNEKPVAEIRLNPASLGVIEVRIVTEQDRTEVSFFAQNSTTKELLENNLPRLRETFTSGGLQLSQVDVSGESMRDSRGRDTASGDQLFTRGSEQVEDEEFVSEAVTQTRLVSDHVVDTFI